MAIKEYYKDGQVQYLVRFKMKSKVRHGLAIQRQKHLGNVTHKEAEKELKELKKAVQRELYFRERSQISWGELLNSWYRMDVMNCNHPTSTKIDNFRTLERYTRSWTSLPVDELTSMSLQIIIKEMEQSGLSVARMKSVKFAVNTVFEWGILNRIIPPSILSPAKGCKLPKLVRKEQPVLNRQEIKILLSKARALDHEYYPVWVVAFETGCRSGELMALLWSDVDFERGLIHVNKSFNSRIGKMKCTKTGIERKLPISPELSSFLKELKLKTGNTGYVLPRIQSWKRGEAARILKGFCKAIGIREINLHATRACFAVMSIESGNSITSTMKLGGWKQIDNFQYYVRLGATEIEGLTDKFNILPSNQAGKVVEFKSGANATQVADVST